MDRILQEELLTKLVSSRDNIVFIFPGLAVDLGITNPAIAYYFQVAGYSTIIAKRYNAEGVALYLASLGIGPFAQYLDRFMIQLDGSEPCRGSLYVLFDLIAESYESIIDVRRNLENIRNMLLRLSTSLESLTDRSLIVDFGCGTGLSYEVAMSFGVQIVGIDTCPMMRRIASRKGMRVLSDESLHQTPRITADAVIASYIFHLVHDHEVLYALWQCINPRGKIVANFHKSVGINAVTEFVTSVGGSSEIIMSAASEFDHGPLIEFSKP
jgi:precorrin-6B methylase 2